MRFVRARFSTDQFSYPWNVYSEWITVWETRALHFINVLPAGVSLDQAVLRASFRWNFYFKTPNINGSSPSLSFIVSRLSLCSFVRFARPACILLISRYTPEMPPRRDGVVLPWHFNTYVRDDFLCRLFPGMLNFLIMGIFALQRKKVTTASEIVPYRLLDYSVSSFGIFWNIVDRNLQKIHTQRYSLHRRAFLTFWQINRNNHFFFVFFL